MFAGDPAPFVMELPAYHWPTVGNVLRSMWERGWSFIKKAGTIITLSTIILWFLMNFGWADGFFGMLDFGDLEGAALEAAQAEGFLRVRCQEQNTKEEKGIHRVSAGVKAKQGVEHHCFTLLLLTN